jgi:hypothetical protein
MIKNVTIQPPINVIGKPQVSFSNSHFDAAIFNEGYNVTIESMIKCPCRTKNSEQLSDCQNCLGTGYVFINKTEDKAIISSINSNTEYKDWSEVKLGTVSVSLMRRGYLSFMDKIIVQDSQVIQSQVVYPIEFNSNVFAYTIYDIDSIVDIFKFVSVDQQLLRLVENVDYTFERNKLLFILTEPFEEFTVSVRYWHKLQYFVIDIPHTIRNNYKKNNLGRQELQLLPINGIARLSHYIVDNQNFNGTNIIDNTYTLTV